MKKIILVLFLLTCTCYASQLDRTIVLDNGLTYDIRPTYANNQLCVDLAVSNGFARLQDGENYDIHPVDSNGSDVASIKFYNTDFGRNFDAYKCTALDVEKYNQIVKFKMLYPAWVEDK